MTNLITCQTQLPSDWYNDAFRANFMPYYETLAAINNKKTNCRFNRISRYVLKEHVHYITKLFFEVLKAIKNLATKGDLKSPPSVYLGNYTEFIRN